MTEKNTDATGTTGATLTVPVLVEILGRADQRMTVRGSNVVTLDDFADVLFVAAAVAPEHPLNRVACIALGDVLRGARAESRRSGKDSLNIDQVASILSLAEGSVVDADELELKVLRQRDSLQRGDPDARAVMDRVAGIYAGDPLTCQPEHLGEVVAMVRDRFEMPELADRLQSTGDNHYSLRV